MTFSFKSNFNRHERNELIVGQSIKHFGIVWLVTNYDFGTFERLFPAFILENPRSVYAHVLQMTSNLF